MKTNVISMFNGFNQNLSKTITLISFLFFSSLSIAQVGNPCDGCTQPFLNICEEQAYQRMTLVTENDVCRTTVFGHTLIDFATYDNCWTLFDEVSGAVIATGIGGTFSHQLPAGTEGCFILRHCAVAVLTGDTYVCDRSFCLTCPSNPDCCRLSVTVEVIPDNPNIQWDMADGNIISGNPATHEYWDVNTYQVNPIPIVGSFGTTLLPSPTIVEEGIWVGEEHNDCSSRYIEDVENRLAVGTRIFAPGGSTNRKISVKGNLRTDGSDGIYTFLDCDFCMHRSSLISVETSGPEELSLRRTHLHDKPCLLDDANDAWFGIRLIGNSPKLRTNGQTIIEGAYNGIKTSATASNRLSIRNTIFKRNFMGIYINKPTNFQGFSNNIFGDAGQVLNWPEGGHICDGSTNGKPELEYPYAGIYADNDETVSLPSVGGFNTFTNICNGIYLNDAKGDMIQNCQFNDMAFGYYPFGVGFDDGRGIYLNSIGFDNLNQIGLGKTGPATFTNCRTGIQVSYAGNIVHVLIQENLMNNVGEGISLGSSAQIGRIWSSSLIKENEINYVENYQDPITATVWGVSHGIFTGGGDKSTDLLIRNNRINTSYQNGRGIGIHMSNMGNLAASFAVRVRDHDDNNDGIFGGFRGVAAVGSNGILVRKNTVDNAGQTGIVLEDTEQSHVMCNEVNGTLNFSRGLWGNMDKGEIIWEHNDTEGYSDGISNQFSSGDATIRCNNFGTHERGFYSENANIGNQGTSSESNGNQWIGTYSDLHARAVNFSYTVYVTPIELPNFMINTFPATWFQGAFSGPVPACSEQCPNDPVSLPEGSNSSNARIASGQISSGMQGERERRNLFDKMLKSPLLVSQSTRMQSFYNSFKNEIGGKLSSLQYQISNLESYTNSENDEIENYSALYQGVLDDIKQLDIALGNGATIQSQLSERSRLYSEKEALSNAIKLIERGRITRCENEQTQLLLDLHKLTSTKIYHLNEFAYLEVYLNSAFVGKSVSVPQTQVLFSLAKQCEYDGGSSILLARDWYNNITQSNEIGSCITSINRSSNIKEEEFDLTKIDMASPNPANQRISLSWESNSFELSFIRVYDAFGREVHSQSLSEESTNLQLDVSQWENGYYFCNLISSNNRIEEKIKFVVQH